MRMRLEKRANKYGGRKAKVMFFFGSSKLLDIVR